MAEPKTPAFETSYIFCEQCGQIITYEVWTRRKQRGRDDWKECSDCRAVPIRQIMWNHPALGRIHCQPHQGELDENWNPINAVGDLFRPGNRICGYKDCVNNKHIIQPEPKTISDEDLFWTLVEAQKLNRKRTN
jgi:hypothetical protein